MKTHMLLPLLFLSACTEQAPKSEPAEHMDAPANVSCTVCRYGPAISLLTGTIVPATFWGPPGYGEDTLSDYKECVFLLKLEKPIEVAADSSDEYNMAQSGLTELQLYSHHNLHSATGRRVTVKGKLFGAITGHHFTKVLLEIQ